MERTLPSRLRMALAPLALVAAYAAIILSSPSVTLADFGPIFLRTLGIAANAYVTALTLLVVGALVSRIARGKTDERPLSFLSRQVGSRWQADRLLPIVTAPIFFALMLTSFSAFKQMILPHAGFGMDPFFAAADRALFLGVDPWRVTHALVPSAWGTWLLDRVYAAWIMFVLFGILLSPFAHAALRSRYLTAFAAVWIVQGTILAFLLPSAGPCYYEHFHASPAFAELMARLQDQSASLGSGSPILALEGQSLLLIGFHSGEAWPAAGISAMPSLHNALAVLFACAGFSIHRALGWLLAVFAFLIWVASIHLGWHYALDGIVGAVVTLLIWRATAPRLQASAPGKVFPAPARI